MRINLKDSVTFPWQKVDNEALIGRFGSYFTIPRDSGKFAIDNLRVVVDKCLEIWTAIGEAERAIETDGNRSDAGKKAKKARLADDFLPLALALPGILKKSELQLKSLIGNRRNLGRVILKDEAPGAALQRHTIYKAIMGHDDLNRMGIALALAGKDDDDELLGAIQNAPLAAPILDPENLKTFQSEIFKTRFPEDAEELAELAVYIPVAQDMVKGLMEDIYALDPARYPKKQ